MSKEINLILQKLIKSLDLNHLESDLLVKKIFKKEIDDCCLSSILTLLFIKGESYEEIKSFVFYLKNKATKIRINDDFMDTCGTGGDNKNSFNFSTATSIVLSSFDVKIVKHGNRSVTSKSGSFDVLESLGIKLFDNPSKVQNFFKKHGICFLFAPFFHPILAEVSHVRKSLLFRTIFNLLGPLLNPANPSFQIIGVSDEKNLQTHSKCLRDLKVKKAWVVHNSNGYDELTTLSENKFIEVTKNGISKVKILDPSKFGFKKCSENELRGGDANENAFLMKRVFEGETGPIRDNVVLNSAVGLVISNKAKNIHEGIEMVNYNINNGLVIKKLNSLVRG